MLRQVVSFLVLIGLAGCASQPNAPAARSSRYEELLDLHKAWRELQKPKVTDQVPDYTPAAMAEQQRGLQGFKSRLDAIDPSAWPIPQQVDWHIVRAEMNGLDFDHRVLRPWSRNPVFYILLANRAARAMGDVKMHSKEATVEPAVKFACDWTPHGWLSETGNTVWFHEQINLECAVSCSFYSRSAIQDSHQVSHHS